MYVCGIYTYIGTMPNIQDIACCDCVGLCNDVSICKCINEQRNYTFQNSLISGICKPIFECNIKCSCNRLRCSNRVVEQGRYMYMSCVYMACVYMACVYMACVYMCYTVCIMYMCTSCCCILYCVYSMLTLPLC